MMKIFIGVKRLYNTALQCKNQHHGGKIDQELVFARNRKAECFKNFTLKQRLRNKCFLV